jgi:hypothetical protein
VVSVGGARAPSSPSPFDDVRPGGSSFIDIWVLLLWQASAVCIQVLAVSMARHDEIHTANVFSCFGFAVTFAAAFWFLTRPRLARAVRNAAVVCLGVTTFVQSRLIDPLRFTNFDEQLHLRTLSDISSAHGLFQENPLLAVSPRYPGLEAVTTLFQQLGLPTMAAATVVVLLARLVLVLALCDVVESLTGSLRAGGLAVAVYAVSPQFVFFNSQFAYQTLALPLALAAVALIARARWVADPRYLLGGATICLLAVAVTHHVTGLLTVGFLLVWATVQRGGQARRRIFLGGVIAAVAMTVWAAIQWSFLRDYFGPIIDDIRSQMAGSAPQRAPFSDSTGSVTTPPWERAFLVYYAVTVALAALWLMLAWVRALRLRQRPPAAPGSNLQRWSPHGLLVLTAVTIPALLAARVLPSGGELFDRASSFLFLPFSVLVADGAVRWFQSRSAPNRLPRSRHHRLLFGSLALVLAAGVFVGGYQMGSGPYWGRLPGSYLVVADIRSMDAETLAAVRWASGGLPLGSRIGADRVGSALLAKGGLWPVTHEGDLNVPSLYYADAWGPVQTDQASRLHLRYLYVDERWADALPQYSTSPTAGYLYDGETPERRQLTRAQLTKFDTVSGVEVVYRHGPISIYDLSGLGVPDVRSGWFGEAHSKDISTQLALGLLLGLTIGLLCRSRWRTVITNVVTSFKTAAGPALTFATAVAALCVASVAVLLANVWLEPPVFAAMGLAALSINPQWALRALKGLFNRTSRLHSRRIAALAAVGLLLAVAIARSVLDVYVVNDRGIQAILEDPSAVHMPRRSPDQAGATLGLASHWQVR